MAKKKALPKKRPAENTLGSRRGSKVPRGSPAEFHAWLRAESERLGFLGEPGNVGEYERRDALVALLAACWRARRAALPDYLARQKYCQSLRATARQIARGVLRHLRRGDVVSAAAAALRLGRLEAELEHLVWRHYPRPWKRDRKGRLVMSRSEDERLEAEVEAWKRSVRGGRLGGRPPKLSNAVAVKEMNATCAKKPNESHTWCVRETASRLNVDEGTIVRALKRPPAR